MKKDKLYLTERQHQADRLLRDGDYKSIREMLERLKKLMPEQRVLAELDEKKEIKYWNSVDLYDEVMCLGDGLLDAGLGGKHIAIISENCVRYIIADICISSGVGVVTPIDVNAPAPLLAMLLAKCDADAALCGSEQLPVLRELQPQCPLLKTLITIDKKVDGVPYYEELIARGREIGESGPYRNCDLDLDAPAKILFTSGTTGANKGVVLSNANLAANMVNCMDAVRAIDEDNTSMSILPMHHATEINTHIMTRIGCGRLTYVNGNIRNMMANMKIFQPTIMTIVPMIVNAFYKNIWAGARKSGKEEKLKKGIKISNLLRKFGIDKTHSMFADVYAPFGGKVNMIVSGGSMLNPVVIKGMLDLGIRLENGYGITECGPLISINSEPQLEHLSVGRPCPGLQVKIANPDEDGIGDLCVRGKSVFHEYYKDPEATAAVFDEEGYFNTGDSARIDEQGRIFLMGRKKNTIVLPSGKNICPEEVENVIETHLDMAEDIVVYQAKLRVGAAESEVLCAGIYIPDEAQRADRDTIVRLMREANAQLPDYKQIDYVELPETGYEKTSTRKIKRAGLPTTCSGKGISLK